MKAPVTRLDETFARLRARGERALVAYLMAGDPSLAETQRLVIEAGRSRRGPRCRACSRWSARCARR
jgi:hypothetical protein